MRFWIDGIFKSRFLKPKNAVCGKSCKKVSFQTYLTFKKNLIFDNTEQCFTKNFKISDIIECKFYRFLISFFKYI